MQDVRYERPTTIAEAARMLAADGARALAGGTDLIPQLREGRRKAAVLVDLKHVADLMRLDPTGDGGWRIGGAVPVRALGADAAFAREHAALLDAARLIGSLQIQSRATLAGNLCNAAPSADAVPLLIALDARIEIASATGTRQIAAAALPTGPGRTALGPGEMVSAILLPPKPARSAARYLRLTPRREMDIAIAGSGVALSLDGAGCIATARIVLASVGPTPVVAAKAADRLVGHPPSLALFAAAAGTAAGEAQPITATRGSAAYRRDMVAVLTRRALADACRQLGQVPS